MPQNMKSLFRWLRHYFLLNGFFNVVVSKLAEYPITALFFEGKNEEISRKWQRYFQEHLRYRLFQLEVGLDYFVYGNAFISLRYPFTKFLRCTGCGWQSAARSCRDHWTFSGHDFNLTCPKCKHSGPAKVHDVTTKVASGARLIRWNPEAITIRYNEVSGHKTFYYDLPGHLRNDIIMGRKHVVEEIPQTFIEAARKNIGVTIPYEQLFHMARPSISGFDRGWGIPLLLCVIKEGFQMQVLQKANEVILMEHLQPLRTIFPQPGAGSADPYTMTSLPLWKEQMSKEIARWRWDPAYIPVMPLPIGQQTIGGEGKALLLDQQIQSKAEAIVVQLGVPKEIIFGGASWSGGTVAMRAVENFFLGYLEEHKALLRFVVEQLRVALDWPEVDAHFKPFRMADDMQRQQLLLQAVQLNTMSRETWLGQMDFDYKQEMQRSEREIDDQLKLQKKQQIGAAKLQAEVAALSAATAAENGQAQQAMQQGPLPGEPGAPDSLTPEQAQQQAAQQQPPAAPGQGGAAPAPDAVDQFNNVISSQLTQSSANRPSAGLDMVAASYAKQISQMQPQEANSMLQALQQQSPDLYAMVMQKLQEMGASPTLSGPGAVQQPAVDMAPLPEKLPPRRASVLGAKKHGLSPRKSVRSVGDDLLAEGHFGLFVGADQAPVHGEGRRFGRTGAITVRHVDHGLGAELGSPRQGLNEVGATPADDLELPGVQIVDGEHLLLVDLRVCLQQQQLVEPEPHQDPSDLPDGDGDLLTAHRARRVDDHDDLGRAADLTRVDDAAVVHEGHRVRPAVGGHAVVRRVGRAHRGPEA